MAGYGTDDAFNSFLTANGLTLPVGAPTVPILRERGSAYIDATYGARFSGTPKEGIDQERAWPRIGATAYGNPIADTATPGAVEKASYHAAYAEAVSPGSLSVIATPGRQIKRQKVEGAVEREFFESGTTDAVAAATPLLSAVEGLLAPLLKRSMTAPMITAI